MHSSDPEPDCGPALLRAGELPGAWAERPLGWLLIAATISLAVLSFAPLAATRFFTWPWILWWHVLLAAAPLAFVAGAATLRPLPRLGAAFDLGLALWAVTAFAGALFSRFHWQSVNAVWIPLAGVCLAYVLRGWIGFEAGKALRREKQVLVALGTLAAAFAVVSFGFWIAFDVVPSLQRGSALAEALRVRNAHPLGHSNYTAGFAVLMLPLLAGLAWTARGRWRAAWATAAAADLALIPTTSSRGGVLALLALAAGAGAVVLFNRRISGRVKLATAGGAIVVACLLVVLNPRLRELVVHRSWSPVSLESNRQRQAMADAGIAMGRARPWLGNGPGTVSLLYPEYRAQLSGGVDNVLELHNTPVQVWAEHGAAGLAALLALGLGVAIAAWRTAFFRDRDAAAGDGTRERRAWATALIASLAGYAVFAVTDYQLDVPLFPAVLAAMLAVLSALTRPAAASHVTWSPTLMRALPAALVAAGAGACAWFTVPDLRARHAFVNGVIALEHGDEGGFAAGVHRAAALAPWEPFYPDQLALHLAARADAATDEAEARKLRAEAVVLLRESLRLRSAQELCHFNLGWLFLDLDQPAAAAPHFRAAAGLVPDKGGVYFGLGLALLLAGREEAATQAFALEWINDPRSATSPAWERPGLRERRAAVATAAGAFLETLAKSPPPATAEPAYVGALLRWWLEPTPANAARAAAAARDAQRRLFFQTMAGEVAAPPAAPVDAAGWELLHEAWRAADPAHALAALPVEPAALREPLAGRIAAHRDSFAEAFTAPVGDSPALVRRLRHERPAYGMLMRNSDGLRVVDRFVFEENLLATDFCGFLFPPKGWLPAPVLVRLLASIPG